MLWYSFACNIVLCRYFLLYLQILIFYKVKRKICL